MLLNNQQITEEIKKEIKIFTETNTNENTTTLNLWDSVKAVLRGRFIAIQAYLKKQEKNQINNLTLHLKQLEKEEMKNPRVSRRKEILKIEAEINAKETKETIAKKIKFYLKNVFYETIVLLLNLVLHISNYGFIALKNTSCICKSGGYYLFNLLSVSYF